MRRTDITYAAGGAGQRALALEPVGPREPALRVEMTDGARLLVRQGEQPLLLGRVVPWHQGVRTVRLPGYRSVVPSLRAETVRRQPDWTHWFADRLADCPHGPLHADRWLLREGTPPHYAWHGELVTAWPRAYLDWGHGWNGVVPLRPLSPPDDPRVKAYRRQLREGSAAPILLWWVTGLDGWLLLDGHDRLVAARAEGLGRPRAIILARGLDDATQEEFLGYVDANQEHRRAQVAHLGAPARAAAERAHADAVSEVIAEQARTTAWPLPGGVPAWDALAARHAPELAREPRD
ncbi:hypothetical protein DN069_35780 [Streptacidiphilus pinicola]|uniref:ParB/Sulfiredoxin domain-containing protein n=1 Tax=Streptacidiphilus pinicola TaxID=2219663 RepID=A0A2X0K045_9ACTN|nr:hypothetical protein [Streptacidiphilus pinicola]RAG80869.1 hypothetical protein DN069_35780 [Streptacidiphilus pinicola]